MGIDLLRETGQREGSTVARGVTDSPSLPRKVRLLSIDGLGSLGSSLVVVVLHVRKPGLATMESLNLKGVLGPELGKLSLEICCAQGGNSIRSEIGHESCGRQGLESAGDA